MRISDYVTLPDFATRYRVAEPRAGAPGSGGVGSEPRD